MIHADVTQSKVIKKEILLWSRQVVIVGIQNGGTGTDAAKAGLTVTAAGASCGWRSRRDRQENRKLGMRIHHTL